MSKFRLKPEAVQFFQEKHSTAIYSFDTWEKIGVDVNALEEIEDAYLTFGHKDKNNMGSSLCGWDGDNGSHFHFTIHFPSTKFQEHDRFANGRVVRDFMNEIQRKVNNFYLNYSEEK